MVPPRGPLNNDEDISAGRQWPARNIDYLKLTIYDPEKSSPYTYINNNSDAQFGTFGGGTASEDAIHASISVSYTHLTLPTILRV